MGLTRAHVRVYSEISMLQTVHFGNKIPTVAARQPEGMNPRTGRIARDDP